jgi:dihydroxyacetone kinase phosphotransfer subunit
MVGLVIVSHSQTLADGVREVAGQMAGSSVRIVTAGGGPDGGLGTDVARISAALDAAWDGDGVLILVDLGSAVMSAQIAIEAQPSERQPLLRLSPAPLVEGAVVAAVEASLGRDLAAVAAAALAARDFPKGA